MGCSDPSSSCTESFALVLGHLWTAYIIVGVAAPPPNIKKEVSAMEEALHQTLLRSFASNCSFIHIIDDSTFYSLDKVLRSGGQMTGGGATFRMVADTKGDDMLELVLARVVAEVRRLRQLCWCLTVVVASDNLAFLVAFAEASERGRMMVWETKMLVVTRLAVPHVRCLLQDYWIFSMMNTMFLSKKEKSVASRWLLHVYLPYSPRGSQVIQVASWSPSRGFILDEGCSLLPEKYSNFHGMGLTVAWFPLPPYWMEIAHPEAENNSDSNFYGRDYLVVQSIAASLNSTISALPYDKNFDELNYLRNRTGIIRPIKLPIMPHMLEKFDFSYFIEPNCLAFCMMKPTMKPSWDSLHYPLQGEVWLSVATSVLIMFASIMLIVRVSEGKHPEAWLVVKQVVGTLIDEAIPGELPRKNATRVLLTSWLIFAFIVGSVYRGNLTASLTAPKYPPRAENFADLVDLGTKVTAPPDMTMFRDSFLMSGSEVLRVIGERMEFVPSFEDVILQIITMNKAYLYERQYLELKVAQYLTHKDGSTPLYITQNIIMSGYEAYPLSLDTPIKPVIDHIIMVLHEAGLIKMWTKEVLQKLKFNRHLWESSVGEEIGTLVGNEYGAGVQRITMSLTLVHIQGILLLYIIGTISSFVIFLSEKTITHCS